MKTKTKWFQNIKLPNGELTIPEKEEIYPPWISLLPFLNYFKNKTVLDVGCNGGYMLVKLNELNCKVTGIDINPIYIEQANYIKEVFNLNCQIFQSDFVKDNFEKFDIVLFSGILYHLDDPIGGFRKSLNLANEYVVMETAFYESNESIFHFGGISKKLYTSTLVPSLKAIEDMIDYCGAEKVEMNLYSHNRCSYVIKPRVKSQKYPGFAS